MGKLPSLGRALALGSLLAILATGCITHHESKRPAKMCPCAGCPMANAAANGTKLPAPASAPATPTPGKSTSHFPLIGETAPSFTIQTTQGTINFPDDYKGKWVILFSHPADFTPVCTTEFMTFATMMPEFEALNCQLIGLSIDSNYSHIAWLRTIQEKIKYKGMEHVEVTFPLIADIKMEVANEYGMIQPSASSTQAVRALFFIDPAAKIRALIYYPLGNGRNFQEIKRLLIAMQTADEYGIATPADWQPGDDVIIPPPGSCGAAAERVAEAGTDYYCLDWFICFKKLDQIKPDR